MFKKSAGGGDFELPDPGSYTFRFTGIVPNSRTVHPPKKEGEKEGVTNQFQFVIDDEDSDWDGVEVRSYFNEYYSDKSKTGKLFAAILGVDELPDEIEEGDLTGKKFKAMLVHQTSAKGTTYPKIESPVAIRARRNRSKPVEEPEDDEAVPF